MDKGFGSAINFLCLIMFVCLFVSFNYNFYIFTMQLYFLEFYFKFVMNYCNCIYIIYAALHYATLVDR